jgi:hypothetical protein
MQMAWMRGLLGLVVLAPHFVLVQSETPPANIIRRDVLQNKPLKPVKAEILQPLLRQDAERVRYFFGPLDIFGKEERKANKTAPNAKITSEGMVFSHQLTGFCTNCMVLTGKADIHFLNGTRATISHGVYDHHLLVLDANKNTLPWWLCPGQTDLGATKLAGFMITGVAEATNYYSAPNSTVKAGYWLGEKQKQFSLNAELINYREHTTPVYVTTEVEYVNGWPKEYLDASMSLLSVTG